MTREDKLRMDAYYYGFDETGLPAIDRILSAVACAGKAFHHTDQWTEDCAAYLGHVGTSPVEWIQNAANDAATAIRSASTTREAALREAAERAATCEISTEEPCRASIVRAILALISSPAPAQPSREAAFEAMRQALRPFADIGQWLFARDLPDDTPLVHVTGLNGSHDALTRGDFKAAHISLADKPEPGETT